MRSQATDRRGEPGVQAAPLLATGSMNAPASGRAERRAKSLATAPLNVSSHSLRRLSHLLLAGLLLGSLSSRAATIPEPDTVFYGQVLNYDHGHELLVTSGSLEWTIHPDADGGRVYRLQTTLEPLANGAFSYRLKVPHEALVNGLILSDLTSTALPQGNAEVPYAHAEIRVNGALAQILPPASSLFKVSADRRASAYRLDLEIAVPMPDADGQGLPDWWQRQFFSHLGVDPNADPDHDGWNNRREYLAGTSPLLANTVPTIAWDHPTVDEGATELLTLRAVDSDTTPAQLVYTLKQAPQGGSLRLLFGATVAGTNGLRGDRVLRQGDTFTQAQLDEGKLIVAQDDPAATQVSFGLSLTDGNTSRAPFQTNFVAVIHRPTADDGTGAAVWLDARAAAAKAADGNLTTWNDRSGPKTWLDGTSAPFDAQAGGSPMRLVPQGPLGQSVVGLNTDGSASAQFLALPVPAKASVFESGEKTVFAVVNPVGGSAGRQQIVNGANFQLALAGTDDHGRSGQVRFASEELGVVYSNHRIEDQWRLVTAWQDQRQLSLELDGAWVGGPHPLDEPIRLGSDPVVGARNTEGVVSEPFQGNLAELLVFNRNLDPTERLRINAALLSKWFGWVILDGSSEERDMVRRVPSTGLSASDYVNKFVPAYGPDRHYILIGGGGQDVLQGGQNDDLIIGGRKADILSGGGGKDRFVFTYAHLHPDADTITDFDPALDQDVIDLTDLFRGDSHDLRDYVHLRTDGHNSYLDLDFLGTGTHTDHTIILQNIVLRDEDRYRLWAGGNLLTGDKRFPLAATLAVAQATVSEAPGDAALITVQFSGAPSVPFGLELPFELAGTAVRGVDYRLSTQRFDDARGQYVWEPLLGRELLVKLKPGDLGFDIRVEPIANRQTDPARTVQLALTPLPEIYDAATSVATVRIVDALPKVSVGAPVAQAIPGGSNGRFQVSRQGSLDVPLDVFVRMTGPAVNGLDYAYIPTVVHFAPGQESVAVGLDALLDENTKPVRIAEMVLESGAGYLVDSGGQAATITIQPSLPLVTVEAYEPLAVQADGLAGSFLFRRRGPTSGTLTVLFELGGSAVVGRDYQKLTRWVVFNPGATLVTVPVMPLAGTPFTGIRTVDLSLLPDASFNLGPSPDAEVRLVARSLTFDRWKGSLFPTDPNPPELFATLDSDGDGLSNLTEYAFGFDAKTPDRSQAGLPQAVIIEGHLGIRFTRPVAVVDVDYFVETSSDLQTWQPATSQFVRAASRLLDISNEEVILLDQNESFIASDHQFVRVQAQLR